MHTDSSLKLFDQVTHILGAEMRYFAGVTCPEFDTCETTAEHGRRVRAQVRRGSGKLGGGPSQPPGRRHQQFNLHTVKFHFLGDYPWIIRWFGTTDSYNTQIASTIYFFQFLPTN